MRVTNKFKFGILLCKKGQTREEDMFGNTSGSRDYEKFLECVGEKVILSGFQKFSGGLDTKANATGTHSLFTEWRGNEIMFHVSSMLFHDTGNEQQVHKKRHIGNDIVLLVFQEADSEPFDPKTVKSNYITVVIVVRCLRNGPYTRPVYYQVSVACPYDVPEFGPKLPYPPIFQLGPKFKDYMLQLCINAELAAYRSKLFVHQFMSTYKDMLSELCKQFPKTKDGAKKLDTFRKKILESS
eukprot:TRINITY_DN1089_c0_g1_i1.p1 TRINITY_DN1089_c0_g1~~TRINITY_DN1089_c0_g1_i1.p1  ORF type:complete len:240 (-),score=19.86 TRINITY_DN1089_c0_g1_i1:118-837(-)